MPLTALVAVSGATYHFDKLYSYLIPAHLESLIKTGSMVLVPFGRGSAKARMGVVLDLEQTQDISRLKSVYDCAPEAARLTGELLELVYYLKQHTFCTYYDAVRAIIPYGAQYKAVNDGAQPRLQKQIIRSTDNFYSRAQMPAKLTEKQQAAWDALSEERPQQALEDAGVTVNVLKRMCEKGILKREEKDKTLSVYDNYTPAQENVQLSPQQQSVYNRLEALMQSDKPQAALLHGVTSSGKTLVFISLIQKCVQLGRTALVLVPEISLTPQMIYRLKAYFGSRVAVQHSALSNTERLLQWQQIQNGEADVVVGTRSAIFAPLENIGLVIIDEEQEHTYHSEQSPRYSAHDIAKKRAVTHSALMLLASATPSTESYYAAQTGRYHLEKLTQRYNDMPLPRVELVDMRTELAEGRTGSISERLAEEIHKNLDNNEQTILLLNRRGYKTVGMCTGCGEVLKCDSCSVPMVYHKSENKLMCHYCGKAITPVPEVCPKCGEKLKYTGFGTQRVEEELAERFPKARVLRMDADTTSRKNSHEAMLGRFAKGEYDIMLGTQMVAKGLDFARVSLVGVLGIDQLLFAQGYKAFENVFSLVTQVVGRGGRADIPGRALIQTVDVNHPVLNLAAKQDYDTFYEQEIAFRKLNLYPPFCTICMLGFTGDDDNETLLAAHAFANMLKERAAQNGKIPLRILGPAPMNIQMVKNKYRYKLTVKCRNDAAFRQLVSDALADYSNDGLPQKAAVYIDFNSDADI